MTDNEFLLAISEMMDVKLKVELEPLKNDLQAVKNEVHQINLYQENVILPRLQTIESCYTVTYNRYKKLCWKDGGRFCWHWAYEKGHSRTQWKAAKDFIVYITKGWWKDGTGNDWKRINCSYYW